MPAAEPPASHLPSDLLHSQEGEAATVLLPRGRTGAEPPPGTGTHRHLAEVLTGGVRRRLLILCGVSAGAFSVGAALSVTTPWLLGTPDECQVLLWLSLVLVALNLLVAAAAWSGRLTTAVLRRLSLWHVLWSTALMAATEMVMQVLYPEESKGVSGICLWILLYPQVLPLSVRAAAITTSACAAALPIAYVLARFAGMEPLNSAALINWFVPPLFCAAIGTAASYSLSRYSTALAEARRQVRELGRYDLLQRIGIGGMGEVWLARHRLLPREAAIKFVRGTAMQNHDPQRNADLSERFGREAQAIALLESPHTVRLYDYGISDDGGLFYVMELLRGFDLQSLVDKHGRLPPGRVALILAQCCLSLGEAHNKGLLHRDIKPGNLMLCRLGSQADFVKVLDFGLVAAMREAAGFGPRGTRDDGSVVGTPGYIAPESLMPDQTPDQRADLYSLGCVGYWLLTGTRVFPGLDVGTEMTHHVMRPIERPSVRIGVELPADLEAILLDCLHKRPEQRPASALHLRERLLGCVCLSTWQETDAHAWWSAHGADHLLVTQSSTPLATPLNPGRSSTAQR